MTRFEAPRGTHDILPTDQPLWKWVRGEMEEVCPDVTFLNYTNPMAMLCWAVAEASRVRCVGLCHSVQHTSQQLAEYCGIPDDEVGYVGSDITCQFETLGMRAQR